MAHVQKLAERLVQSVQHTLRTEMAIATGECAVGLTPQCLSV